MSHNRPRLRETVFSPEKMQFFLCSITDCRIRWVFHRRDSIRTKVCYIIHTPNTSCPREYLGYPKRRDYPTVDYLASRIAYQRPTARH